MKKKIGWGTAALALVIAGVVLSSNIYEFSLGDYLLQKFDIPTWTDEDNPYGAKGLRLTPYYFLPLYLLAFYLGKKFGSDFGAELGKRLALVMIVLMVFFTLFTTTMSRVL